MAELRGVLDRGFCVSQPAFADVVADTTPLFPVLFQ